MSRGGSGIQRQNLFMYLTDEGKLISEIRLISGWEDGRGSAIRKVYDLEQKTNSLSLLNFKDSWWRSLHEETPFDFTKPEDKDFELNNKTEIMISKFFDFCTNPNLIFLTSPKEIKGLYSEDINRAEEIGLSANKVTNLLRTIVSSKDIECYKSSMKKYKDTFDKSKEEKKDEDQSQFLSRLCGGMQSLHIAQEIKGLGEIATNLVVIAEDSKKYTKAFLEELE